MTRSIGSPLFLSDAKKRHASIDIPVHPSHKGLPLSGPVPEWVRQKMKQVRRNGGLDVFYCTHPFYQVIVPPGCIGLDDFEKEEDISFLKLVSSGNFNPSPIQPTNEATPTTQVTAS